MPPLIMLLEVIEADVLHVNAGAFAKLQLPWLLTELCQ